MSRLSTWPAIALLAAIAVSVQADDAPTCPTPDQPTENAPDHGICANAGSDPREEEFEDSFWGCLQYHTLLEKNYPGICDVDASTPDGKA